MSNFYAADRKAHDVYIKLVWEFILLQVLSIGLLFYLNTNIETGLSLFSIAIFLLITLTAMILRATKKTLSFITELEKEKTQVVPTEPKN
jgi:hypothetical protein